MTEPTTTDGLVRLGMDWCTEHGAIRYHGQDHCTAWHPIIAPRTATQPARRIEKECVFRAMYAELGGDGSDRDSD